MRIKDAKYVGYCPHCGAKITEVKIMGYFDDFTFKCWKCSTISKNYNIKFKYLTNKNDNAKIAIGN